MRTNFKQIHRKGGTIELYINDQFIKSKKYQDVASRQQIIDVFRWTYPPHPYQTRYFILKPDWDNWNRKLEDDPIPKQKTSKSIIRNDSTEQKVYGIGITLFHKNKY